MKILRGRVDWMEGRVNRPNLYLLFAEEPPSLDEFRFRQRAQYYFAERDGFCRFFSWNGQGNNGGFGGNRYPITMVDGRQITLHGPWSSNCGVMNEHGFGPCINVIYTTDVEKFESGNGRGGAVLISTIRDHAAVIDIGTGYTWRPGSTYAAEVAFPVGSSFALAACGHVTLEKRDSRQRDFVSLPEVYPDGVTVDSIRAAILAAQAADDHDLALTVARRYARYHRVEPIELFMSLSDYEPAVKLPNGEFWTKPD